MNLEVPIYQFLYHCSYMVSDVFVFLKIIMRSIHVVLKSHTNVLSHVVYDCILYSFS